MAKSFENYEKETAGDKVKYWLKLVGIAFAGALVGAPVLIDRRGFRSGSAEKIASSEHIDQDSKDNHRKA